LRPFGPVKVLEAVDENGKPFGVAEPETREQADIEVTAADYSPALAATARLKPQNGASARIKRLRGMIPVEVHALRPEALVIPLSAQEGRTYRGTDVSVTIKESRVRPSDLDILLHTEPNFPTANSDQDSEGQQLELLRPEAISHQISLIDDAGTPFPWSAPGSISTAGDGSIDVRVVSSSYLWRIAQGDQSKGPKWLRFRETVAFRTEVPFTFTDLPQP
jgi:hypothetical protein